MQPTTIGSTPTFTTTATPGTTPPDLLRKCRTWQVQAAIGYTLIMRSLRIGLRVDLRQCRVLVISTIVGYIQTNLLRTSHLRVDLRQCRGRVVQPITGSTLIRSLRIHHPPTLGTVPIERRPDEAMRRINGYILIRHPPTHGTVGPRLRNPDNKPILRNALLNHDSVL